MQHSSSFLTLNQSSLWKQSKETQYFSWKQSETKYKNTSADIRAIRLINQKDIVNWIIKLDPEQFDEVFSFTNREHAMKIIKSPNSEFLNYIKILSVNELFDTVAAINNKFVDYFLRMVEQYHLFLEQEIQIIKLQDTTILELRTKYPKMQNSTEQLILKEFEKSIILRYFQEKDNCYYTSPIKTVSLQKCDIPYQKQQMEQALLRYQNYLAQQKDIGDLTINEKGQNVNEKGQNVKKKVDSDVILLNDLGFALEKMEIQFYEDHYQSQSDNQWFIKQFFGLPQNQIRGQTLTTFLISSIMVQTQIAQNYLDENHSSKNKNKNKKKSKQKQKSNTKRIKQSQPHICQDNCEIEKQSKNLVNSIFSQIYEQLEQEHQPSIQKPIKKKHNHKIKELLQDDLSQEIQLKNNEEFQLSDCNQKQTTISTTTINSSSNSESDENYQYFAFNGIKEDNNDAFQKNKQNSSNNKKNKQIPTSQQQPMSPKQNEEKQYSLSQQSTPIKQKKKLKINSDMKLPYKNNVNLEKDLDEFSNTLIFKNCGYKNSKIICFHRLQFIVNMILQAALVVYGSVATGLDLEDSDVDIMIVGYEHYNYNLIQKQLQMLHNKLLELPFVISAKLILGNIPLLKLELTPQGKFYDSDYYVRANRNLFFLQTNEFTKIVSVDLTWNTQWGPQYVNQHNGFQSTSIINQWIFSYVGFRELILILKYLLKKKNLNDAYQGGISSYCLSIMLAAIYQFQVSQCDKKQTLLQFLDKYGNNFDPQNEGIDVCIYHQNPFIQLEDSPTHPPLTVFSPVNKTIISNKATKINEILQEFKQFHQHLLQNNNIHEYFQNKN